MWFYKPELFAHKNTSVTLIFVLCIKWKKHIAKNKNLQNNIYMKTSFTHSPLKKYYFPLLLFHVLLYNKFIYIDLPFTTWQRNLLLVVYILAKVILNTPLIIFSHPNYTMLWINCIITKQRRLWKSQINPTTLTDCRTSVKFDCKFTHFNISLKCLSYRSQYL